MPFKRKTEKRLGFPFLKTRSFNFQPFWNFQKLGVVYDEVGPLPIRIKKVICFGDLKMILLLQNFANLKILPCSLDWVCKISEFWSISWYFWSLKTFFIVSCSAFFSRSDNCRLAHSNSFSKYKSLGQWILFLPIWGIFEKL